MIQKTLSVGPLACNCQILICPKTFETVIVDPGADADRILNEIKKLETKHSRALNVKALLHTHAHFDHIGATREVVETFKASGISAPQIFLHKEDEFIYSMLPQQGMLFGFDFSQPLAVDQFVEDEEQLKFGELKFTVLHTPGHSPGGVCFRLHSDSQAEIPEVVFTGDTLFKQSIGRSDLWGGDHGILVSSIQNRLFTLDGDTVVWPGHGPETRVGVERMNPCF